MFLEMDKNSKRGYLLGAFALALIFVLYVLVVNYRADDGYIALQYVKNFLRGYGLVYFPGERVEGYSSFLWVITVAGAKLLLPFLDLATVGQVVGVLFSLLTILVVSQFYPLIHSRYAPAGLVAPALLAVHSGFVAWATGDLETNMFAFFVVLAAFTYIIFLKTGRYFYLIPFIFVATALTRFDGLLFFGLTSIHAAIWMVHKKGLSAALRQMIIWTVIFLALYGAYFIWRYSYYGYLLPNTFYAKVGSGISQYLRGLYYLKNYVVLYGWFVFLPGILFGFFKLREPWVNYLVLVIGAYLGYLVYAGGDGLGFFRFIVYIAPLIYLLVQEGIAAFAGWVAPHLGSLRRFAWLPAGLFIVAALWTTTRQTANPLIFPGSNRWYDPQSGLYFPDSKNNNPYVWYDNYFVDRQAVAAKWLEKNLPSGATVASTPAGAIAYFMDLKVIDMLGLNDVHIAHTQVTSLGSGRAGHEKGDGKYVLARAPEVILMGNVAVYPAPVEEKDMAGRLSLKSEHELWADPEFHARYEMVCVDLSSSGVMRYFIFYMRKDVGLATLTNVSYNGCPNPGKQIGSLDVWH